MNYYNSFAKDENGERVHIDDADKDFDYFCDNPICNGKMMIKRGDERRHHFAHCSGNYTCDEYAKKGYYCDSEWHDSWQNEFPKQNREIWVGDAKVKHRADVMIGTKIVEFQHSKFKKEEFKNRNSFYSNHSLELVWLFDLSEFYNDGKFRFNNKNKNGYYEYEWHNPISQFSNRNSINPYVSVFFEIKEDLIVSLIDIDNTNKNDVKIITSSPITKIQFLKELGVENGKCPPPDIEAIEKISKRFSDFSINIKNEIKFDSYQQKIIQNINGAVMVDGGIGSGKSTLLAARVGYLLSSEKS